jgi:hypothetical protein
VKLKLIASLFIITIAASNAYAEGNKEISNDLSSCCGQVIEYEIGNSVTVNGKTPDQPLVCSVGFGNQEIENKAAPIILAGLHNPQLMVCLYFYMDNTGLQSISVQAP